MPSKPLATDSSPQSEEVYRDIVDHVLEGIIVVQGDQVLYANPMACEITGHTRSALEKIALIDLIHPEDRAMIQDFQQRRRDGSFAEQAGEPQSQYRIGLAAAAGVSHAGERRCPPSEQCFATEFRWRLVCSAA